MEITKELIYKIICDHSNGADLPLAEYIANRIKIIQTIAQEMRFLQNKQFKIKNDYQNALAEWNKDFVEIQKKCKHELTKHHLDASGNNDSWTNCEICEKLL
jgi:hypothetical protein